MIGDWRLVIGDLELVFLQFTDCAAPLRDTVRLYRFGQTKQLVVRGIHGVVAHT